MKVLDLVLMFKWYDMIDAGIKPEEYREISHYWLRRLFLQGDYLYLWKPLGKYSISAEAVQILKKQVCETAEMRFRDYEIVRFHRGYTSTVMEFAVKDIEIGMGNSEWGAPTNKEVFIIKLGKRL